jgi:single-stranded-DNA-specific exonuclease
MTDFWANLVAMLKVWKLLPQDKPTPEYLERVQSLTANLLRGDALALILWQRGIGIESLAAFLNPDEYPTVGPEAFGEEMGWAIDRLVQAYRSGEKVAIWGDFDADGVTATAVLWEGLGQFFPRGDRLGYLIPDRLTESHGLSSSGLERLKNDGYSLVVTCDTGSTNCAEIEYGRSIGLEFVITDHHTLPKTRPGVVAIVNPRYFEATHPLYSLSGVGVAYKLVEALYRALPEGVSSPLYELLDLVAIGLIADLVELRGESRYLAQKGILQMQKAAKENRRPGVTKLLELCKRSGDRPTDISFGIGPRINAVSRIQGRADFCVELLTSRDEKQAHALAMATELANSRRRSLQQDMEKMVAQKVVQLDLSTTDVIVLADEQWHPGVLGLVASQVAAQYDRPTILLTLDPVSGLARGSARSTRDVDLYQLVLDQSDLLHKFGGHPFAAGLSLPIENLPLFTLGINQRLRQLQLRREQVTIADLQVTVAELGIDLFQSLKLLEPCGMGNPSPKLLLQNVALTDVKPRNIKDAKGRKVKFNRVGFNLKDETGNFPGIWWGHRAEELPKGRVDVIVELESNPYQRCYEARLVAVRSTTHAVAESQRRSNLLDWRSQIPEVKPEGALVMTQPPYSWEEFRVWQRRAMGQPLALAFAPPGAPDVGGLWMRWVGLAKYLSRTGERVGRSQLLQKLGIGDRALQVGFRSIAQVGFRVSGGVDGFQFSGDGALYAEHHHEALEAWSIALQEEYFMASYFARVPLEMLAAILSVA